MKESGRSGSSHYKTCAHAYAIEEDIGVMCLTRLPPLTSLVFLLVFCIIFSIFYKYLSDTGLLTSSQVKIEMIFRLIFGIHHVN